MTVPSCELHNNANSKDVEYTRNVLSTYLGANTVGQQHFNDKAMRSFDHSPKLLFQTFGKMRSVKLRGVTVAAYPTEAARITNVIRSCVRALYFARTGERKPHWHIVLASLGYESNSPSAFVKQWAEMLSIL